MVQENQRDWFEEWLMIHPDELEKLQKKLGHLDLDYTPESLLRVEAWVLENYSSPDEILKDEEKMTLDGLLRYVGEVFKIHLQGRWNIHQEDPEHLFYNLPVISFPGNIPDTSPLSLITASLDRKSGNFLYDSLNRKKNYMESQDILARRKPDGKKGTPFGPSGFSFGGGQALFDAGE
ncbi:MULTISPECIES: hypothetical protein [Thermoactinomyces]|nr:MULTISPECIES: hypothetical protein [Thermoactinomyces]KFZ40562.1 hypothetical protein JS81_06805 [Thermoactinomyces sp. Gus2-1]KYQ87271.1 hypothetical protein AYX07_00760 [Thermoactinomyces sp. AS95]MBH8584131.1 hypothetical protein [Thermoactinomyces sp. CICC 10735]MBH8586721.1 hypothetical protein [Thermoactinomyces sp. CICC 10520]MBI0387698.1 hypothetical protein [Thermoactinomyces sp. CICC 24227]